MAPASQGPSGSSTRNGGSSERLLYIGCISRVSNAKRRRLVREYWLSALPRPASGARVVAEFLMGRLPIQGIAQRHHWGTWASPEEIEQEELLQTEQMQYGDITRLPLLDVYDELSNKVLLLFARGVGLGYKYIMKVDDDQVLDFAYTAKLLSQRASWGPLYAGAHKAGAQEPEGWTPQEIQLGADQRFEPYLIGECYMLSRDLAGRISGGDLDHSVAYNSYGSTSEDVNMGHWVAWEDRARALSGPVEYRVRPFCHRVPGLPVDPPP